MALLTAPTGSDLSLCIPDLKARKKDSALSEMVDGAERAGVVRNPSLLLELLKLRERLGTTAIGKGVALPHARSITVHGPRLVVARSRRGIEWGANDALPASIVLMVLAPAEWSDEAYHALLGRAASAARLQRARLKLLAAPSPDAAAAVLQGLVS